MTHASLFSGIGGPEVAAAMMGWENAFLPQVMYRIFQTIEFAEAKSKTDINF